VKQTAKLTDDEIARLHDAAKRTLVSWIKRLRDDFAGDFPGPGQITAFRPGFAVHGKFGQPCPGCGSPVQRIRYVDNETNYCAKCQTDGRLLADRSLSRLLKEDWPRTLEEQEGR
jgi:formamidopyrimidine-DNA glycosylase